jgi:hypothetical protein
VYQFCDACRERINGEITVIRVETGELIRLSSGREHLRSAAGSRFHVLCASCGRRAADVLQAALREFGGTRAAS